MVDKTNKAGKAPTAVSDAGDFSSLESYISTNGPMNWRECLALFHDVCFKMETAPADSTDIGELTIHSFLVRRTDTAGGISIDLPSGAEALDSKVKKTEHSFPAEAYMSPEKCLDRPVNRRSDVYSLGCVIYHCLTGAPPFMHRDADQLKEMQTIDYALPPGRRSQRRVIPDEVDMLVSNCLEKDPAKRVKNAGALRANIGRVLQIDDDQSDEPPLHSKKFAEFSKRKRNIFFSVAALVAVTAGMGWLSLNLTSSDDFQRLVKRTVDSKKNKYLLGLEYGNQFVAQAEFGNGKMVPDLDKDPIEIKVKDQDVIIFATTKRKTMKEALEEAIRRNLTMYKADLSGQDLQGIKIPGEKLFGCFMMGCNLDGADLTGTYMQKTIFAGSSMKCAHLNSTNSPEAVFQGCNLEGATLSSAILLDCDFSKANLKNANFSNAKLGNTSFKGADLTGAIFTGATLSKDTLATANLTADQKSKIEVVQGAVRNANKQSDKNVYFNRPGTPIDVLKERNPFSNPVEGTFGPPQNDTGLKIDLQHLPPAPPRKVQAPQPPPLQPAIPGQKLTPNTH